METAAEFLTRREKNRLAAARSNERRKRALETLRFEFAQAKMKILTLMDREAEARNLNQQLKDEIVRRWTREVASSSKS